MNSPCRYLLHLLPAVIFLVLLPSSSSSSSFSSAIVVADSLTPPPNLDYVAVPGDGRPEGRFRHSLTCFKMKRIQNSSQNSTTAPLEDAIGILGGQQLLSFTTANFHIYFPSTGEFIEDSHNNKRLTNFAARMDHAVEAIVNEAATKENKFQVQSLVSFGGFLEFRSKNHIEFELAAEIREEDSLVVRTMIPRRFDRHEDDLSFLNNNNSNNNNVTNQDDDDDDETWVEPFIPSFHSKPESRAGHSSFVLSNNRFYIFGGSSSTSQLLGETWSWSFDLNANNNNNNATNSSTSTSLAEQWRQEYIPHSLSATTAGASSSLLLFPLFDVYGGAKFNATSYYAKILYLDFAYEAVLKFLEGGGDLLQASSITPTFDSSSSSSSAAAARRRGPSAKSTMKRRLAKQLELEKEEDDYDDHDDDDAEIVKHQEAFEQTFRIEERIVRKRNKSNNKKKKSQIKAKHEKPQQQQHQRAASLLSSTTPTSAYAGVLSLKNGGAKVSDGKLFRKRSCCAAVLNRSAAVCYGGTNGFGSDFGSDSVLFFSALDGFWSEINVTSLFPSTSSSAAAVTPSPLSDVSCSWNPLLQSFIVFGGRSALSSGAVEDLNMYMLNLVNGTWTAHLQGSSLVTPAVAGRMCSTQEGMTYYLPGKVTDFNIPATLFALDYRNFSKIEFKVLHRPLFNPLPLRRAYHVTAAIGTQIYAGFGRSSSQIVMYDFFRYDPVSGEYFDIAGAREVSQNGNWGASSSTFGSVMYIFGGRKDLADNSNSDDEDRRTFLATNSLIIFEASRSIFKAVAYQASEVLPLPRAFHVSFIQPDLSLLIIGLGENGASDFPQDDWFAFSIARQNWIKLQVVGDVISPRSGASVVQSFNSTHSIIGLGYSKDAKVAHDDFYFVTVQVVSKISSSPSTNSSSNSSFSSSFSSSTFKSRRRFSFFSDTQTIRLIMTKIPLRTTLPRRVVEENPNCLQQQNNLTTTNSSSSSSSSSSYYYYTKECGRIFLQSRFFRTSFASVSSRGRHALVCGGQQGPRRSASRYCYQVDFVSQTRAVYLTPKNASSSLPIPEVGITGAESVMLKDTFYSFGGFMSSDSHTLTSELYERMRKITPARICSVDSSSSNNNNNNNSVARDNSNIDDTNCSLPAFGSFCYRQQVSSNSSSSSPSSSSCQTSFVPAGFFSTIAGLQISCPRGTQSKFVGSTSVAVCSPCLAGSFALNNSYCQLCKNTSFCPTGSLSEDDGSSTTTSSLARKLLTDPIPPDAVVDEKHPPPFRTIPFPWFIAGLIGGFTLCVALLILLVVLFHSRVERRRIDYYLPPHVEQKLSKIFAARATGGRNMSLTQLCSVFGEMKLLDSMKLLEVTFNFQTRHLGLPTIDAKQFRMIFVTLIREGILPPFAGSEAEIKGRIFFDDTEEQEEEEEEKETKTEQENEKDGEEEEDEELKKKKKKNNNKNDDNKNKKKSNKEQNNKDSPWESSSSFSCSKLATRFLRYFAHLRIEKFDGYKNQHKVKLRHTKRIFRTFYGAMFFLLGIVITVLLLLIVLLNFLYSNVTQFSSIVPYSVIQSQFPTASSTSSSSTTTTAEDSSEIRADFVVTLSVTGPVREAFSSFSGTTTTSSSSSSSSSLSPNASFSSSSSNGVHSAEESPEERLEHACVTQDFECHPEISITPTGFKIPVLVNNLDEINNYHSREYFDQTTGARSLVSTFTKCHYNTSTNFCQISWNCRNCSIHKQDFSSSAAATSTSELSFQLPEVFSASKYYLTTQVSTGLFDPFVDAFGRLRVADVGQPSLTSSLTQAVTPLDNKKVFSGFEETIFKFNLLETYFESVELYNYIFPREQLTLRNGYHVSPFLGADGGVVRGNEIDPALFSVYFSSPVRVEFTVEDNYLLVRRTFTQTLVDFVVSVFSVARAGLIVGAVLTGLLDKQWDRLMDWFGCFSKDEQNRRIVLGEIQKIEDEWNERQRKDRERKRKEKEELKRKKKQEQQEEQEASSSTSRRHSLLSVGVAVGKFKKNHLRRKKKLLPRIPPIEKFREAVRKVINMKRAFNIGASFIKDIEAQLEKEEEQKEEEERENNNNNNNNNKKKKKDEDEVKETTTPTIYTPTSNNNNDQKVVNDSFNSYSFAANTSGYHPPAPAPAPLHHQQQKEQKEQQQQQQQNQKPAEGKRQQSSSSSSSFSSSVAGHKTEQQEDQKNRRRKGSQQYLDSQHLQSYTRLLNLVTFDVKMDLALKFQQVMFSKNLPRAEEAEGFHLEKTRKQNENLSLMFHETEEFARFFHFLQPVDDEDDDNDDEEEEEQEESEDEEEQQQRKGEKEGDDINSSSGGKSILGLDPLSGKATVILRAKTIPRRNLKQEAEEQEKMKGINVDTSSSSDDDDDDDDQNSFVLDINPLSGKPTKKNKKNKKNKEKKKEEQASSVKKLIDPLLALSLQSSVNNNSSGISNNNNKTQQKHHELQETAEKKKMENVDTNAKLKKQETKTSSSSSSSSSSFLPAHLASAVLSRDDVVSRPSSTMDATAATSTTGRASSPPSRKGLWSRSGLLRIATAQNEEEGKFSGEEDEFGFRKRKHDSNSSSSSDTDDHNEKNNNNNDDDTATFSSEETDEVIDLDEMIEVVNVDEIHD